MNSFSIIFLVCLALSSLAIKALNVSYDGRAITIDGKRRVLLSGSIHYPRSTPEMWPSLINKAKQGGLNVIETYVFWNAHEPLHRQYDFSGNLDLVRFIKTIQDEGLYAMLRIGPYVCAEWNYGGFPVWLHNIPNIELRTNNRVYQDEMKNFTTKIVDLMRHEKLFASQGGPIILAQIENEYGNVMGPYGNGGKEYIKWCAQLAESYQIGVPWVMCQQNDAPDPMINSCNGYYCDNFQPNNGNKPKTWTENWTGWFNNWGGAIPHRTAEDIAFAVVRFFQYGGTFQNYYMYHGGTNFGRTSGGPYITTSYDYDAPLDEYGNFNQPKWGHLKNLHVVLKSMEAVLTQGSSSTVDYGNMTTATVYSYAGKSACFLGNAHPTNDNTINFQNVEYTIPAWSVSILPDCRSEAYNTAKVNAQTSIMVKKQNQADNGAEPLKWEWMYEPFRQMKNGKILGNVSMTASKLLDQKVVTNDISDYLWHITSVDVQKGDPILSNHTTLRVKTNGHLLHVFVNGKRVGSQYAKYDKYKFDYEANVSLKQGKNEITLLSGTVGLPNYGAHFDDVQVGIPGPVLLITSKDNTDIIKNISNNSWSYKVGLHGENVKHYKQASGKGWYTNGLPTERGFVWYKTMFESPIGSDPVVVDLKGLGKGQAWVNGNNIGRYWPKYLARYHIPRSFLTYNGPNTLVLFEELGGNPYDVKFATITIEKACANAYEGNKLELACNENQVISEVKFASFGLPVGNCGSFKKGECDSSNALSVIKSQCVGQQSCSIEVSERVLGPTGCRVSQLRLAVDALCGTTVSTEMKKH
ncbi:PREDICTED: beta-galactosidase 15 isoform X2 [Lupinus angustifolius]|uniref:beta-galactosidase 15 isoform X2 n=1 Tax=Lupinus angustifolius TaxID=3871 RepID=UPI00092E63E3|nr:PREDICTED: beta-galactosidase 15 isoform X2 [Lupinus angustifolius]